MKIKNKEMKAFRFLAITVISALAFTACSKDDTGIDPGTGGNTKDGDIVFNIGFAPQNDEKAQTYVATAPDFKSTWKDGDAIGLYAVSHANGVTGTLATSGNYIHNVKLTYSSANGKLTPEEVIYYSGAQMDFYAYYPYDAAATDPTNITFNVLDDQSTADNYNLSELLSAKTTNIANGTTVDLTFTHMLALVEVEVAPTYIDRNSDFTATLRGCKAAGVFDLSDGTLSTEGNAQAVKMFRVEKSGYADYTGKYTYRALVPAQSVAIGTSLCLMSHGEQFYSTPKLAEALELIVGDAKLYTATLPVTALQTVKISKGTFQMGQVGIALPVHEVTLTKDFYMSKYNITNAQYAIFLNANSIGSDGKGSVTYYYDSFTTTVTEDKMFIEEHVWGVKLESDKWVSQTGYDNHPIINMSWFGAKAYADWIGGSLPTEAQWEYACRAGTTTTYSFGDDPNDLGDYAWYGVNSGSKTHPVGEKLPNPWGLYDMHGNVSDCCSDWYDAYNDSAVADPTGPAIGGNSRLRRGGNWSLIASRCRSADRASFYPGNYLDYIGFRVVFVL